MTEPPKHGSAAPLPTARGGRSVFAKLVSAMLAMGMFLVLIVTVFFGFLVGPNLNSVIFRLAREYSTSFAATSPDLAAARQLAGRLEVQIRYDGPSDRWATSPGLPSVEDVRSGRVRASHLLIAPRYYVAPAPQGGAYLFAWDFSG